VGRDRSIRTNHSGTSSTGHGQRHNGRIEGRGSMWHLHEQLRYQATTGGGMEPRSKEVLGHRQSQSATRRKGHFQHTRAAGGSIFSGGAERVRTRSVRRRSRTIHGVRSSIRSTSACGSGECRASGPSRQTRRELGGRPRTGAPGGGRDTRLPALCPGGVTFPARGVGSRRNGGLDGKHSDSDWAGRNAKPEARRRDDA